MSIKSKEFIKILKKNSFFSFSGVPDSTFGNLFLDLGEDKDINYYKANREDSALGISSGISISGNNTAVVMQNSGIGNLINPLTSFNLLYRIPVLLIIGWRGYGGMPKDAPEHWIMGEKSVNFFELLDIPVIKFTDCEENSSLITKKINTALKTYEKENLTRVLLFRKGVIK